MKHQTLFKKSASLDEVPNVAKEILNILPNSAVVALEGNLAAGKTTLVSAIAKELGFNAATSPTFALQQVYGNGLFHYDFYRVDFEQIAQMGLIDEFEKEGLHFVEWVSEELVDLLLEAGFEVYSMGINNLGSSREYILRKLGE